MYILGIETSCDETAAAVSKDGRTILSDIIYSQADIHKTYGGVVPEIASRKHIEKISYVVNLAIEKANIKKEDIDLVAVTHGPGLVGALLVGVSFAKAFSFAINKPLVGVNHIYGHIAANYITHKDLTPPFVCLVASGGHSHIVKVEDYHKFKLLGATRDDAAGEAFDKVSRVLGFGYPGGPLINEAAKHGNKDAIPFPRVSMGLDFSFSGLKTAVINYIHNCQQKNEEYNKYDVAASFQSAVVDVLVKNTIEAAKKEKVGTICLAGGVAANTQLREEMKRHAVEEGLKFYCPDLKYCTDNAAMIACEGYYAYKEGVVSDLTLNALPSIDSFLTM